MKFLHVGCGQKRKDRTLPALNSDEWEEVRFDINEKVAPDIVGTMTDLSAVADNEFDAVFSSHNIEHLFTHEVPIALKEFLRVLKPEGFLLITCPDLQSVAKLVAEDKLVQPAYESPAGPISPLDILYGHRASIARGDVYMAHKCGFTKSVLSGTLGAAGFAGVASKARAHPHYDLWALATKSQRTEDELKELFSDYIGV